MFRPCELTPTLDRYLVASGARGVQTGTTAASATTGTNEPSETRSIARRRRSLFTFLLLFVLFASFFFSSLCLSRVLRRSFVRRSPGILSVLLPVLPSSFFVCSRGDPCPLARASFQSVSVLLQAPCDGHRSYFFSAEVSLSHAPHAFERMSDRRVATARFAVSWSTLHYLSGDAVPGPRTFATARANPPARKPRPGPLREALEK